MSCTGGADAPGLAAVAAPPVRGLRPSSNNAAISRDRRSLSRLSELSSDHARTEHAEPSLLWSTTERAHGRGSHWPRWADPVAEHSSCWQDPHVAGDPQPAELVRAHMSAFNERDLGGLLDELSLEVVWQTGADAIVGRAEVGTLMAAACEGSTPSLEIRSALAGDALAAVEMVSTTDTRAWMRLR